MTFRHFLIVMTLATVFAWMSWIVVLVSIDPARSGGLGQLFFYLSLTGALFGTVSLSMAGIRIWLNRDHVISRQVAKSFRQGVLLTGLIIGALLLLPANLFRWWTIGLMVGFLALIELACLSIQGPRSGL